MADKDKKIDPFDVEALEKSLNDSATRVSTIWVSFLIFSLYLLTAATTVTHRQLFLAEPLKLPVLNIDLPLWGFFFLAPILFVIFHAYVLIQVILLARTAAAYNEAVDRGIEDAVDNARVRQRLANTLFAQILAGSPRERTGWLGWLLRVMAWITLAIAPILILVVFQFMFLPYHSHLATWAHRLLILTELVAIYSLWPLALHSRREPNWWRIRRQIGRITSFPLWLLAPWDRRELDWKRLRQQLIPSGSFLLSVLASFFLATFPSEPHARWTRYLSSNNEHDRRPLECRTTSVIAVLLPGNFDRLYLPSEDVVDDDKLAKIEAATKAKGQPAMLGERTRKFDDRDLTCSNLNGADLRFTSFENAKLRGAILTTAELQGATLWRADMRGALFYSAKLEGAFLGDAQLQNAQLQEAQLQDSWLIEANLQNTSFERANFQGASLSRALLQGASLNEAELQRANLNEAHLQGASLKKARLAGASLKRAQLQGADLDEAQLQGASLDEARLHGASLRKAQLQATSLSKAEFHGADLEDLDFQGSYLNDTQLQGARLTGSRLTLAYVSPYLWRTGRARCDDAQVVNPSFDAVIDVKYDEKGSGDEIEASPEAIERFIQNSTSGVPDQLKAKTQAILRNRLTAGLPSSEVDETRRDWENCAAKALPSDEFDRKFVRFLIDLACSASGGRQGIAHGIRKIWTIDWEGPFQKPIASALAGLAGKVCLGAGELDEKERVRLRELAEKNSAADTP